MVFSRNLLSRARRITLEHPALRKDLYLHIPAQRAYLFVGPAHICETLIGPTTCQLQCGRRAGTSTQSAEEGSVSLAFSILELVCNKSSFHCS